MRSTKVRSHLSPEPAMSQEDALSNFGVAQKTKNKNMNQNNNTAGRAFASSMVDLNLIPDIHMVP